MGEGRRRARTRRRGGSCCPSLESFHTGQGGVFTPVDGKTRRKLSVNFEFVYARRRRILVVQRLAVRRPGGRPGSLDEQAQVAPIRVDEPLAHEISRGGGFAPDEDDPIGNGRPDWNPYEHASVAF